MPTTNQGLLDAYNALFSNSPFGAMIRRRVMLGLQQQRSPGGSQTRSSMPSGLGPDERGSGNQSPSPLGGPSTSVNTAAGVVPGVNASGSISPTGTSLTDRYGPAAEGLPSSWSPTSAAQTGVGWRGWNNAAAKNAAKYGFVGAGLLGAGAGYVGGGLIGGLTRYNPTFPGVRMPRFNYGGPAMESYTPAFSAVADRSKFDMGWGGAPGVGEAGGYGGAGFDPNSPDPNPGSGGDAGYGPGASFY